MPHAVAVGSETASSGEYYWPDKREEHLEVCSKTPITTTEIDEIVRRHLFVADLLTPKEYPAFKEGLRNLVKETNAVSGHSITRIHLGERIIALKAQIIAQRRKPKAA